MNKQPGAQILNDPGNEPSNYLDYLGRLSREDLEGEVAELVADTLGGLLTAAEAADATAGTSAASWEVDDYEIQGIDLGDGECVVSLTFSAGAGPEADQADRGDRLSGSAEAVIDRRGGVSYQNVAAELEEDGFEGPDRTEE